MSDLGNFMKKRTRDLLIGVGLVGVGMAGAVAFQIYDDRNQGSIIITNGQQTLQTQTVPSTAQPVTQGRSYTIDTQYHSQNTEHGPAYQHPQSNFTQPSIHPQATSNLGIDPSLCAPEALKVGIKHFRYADADPSDLVPSGYGSDPKFKIHRAAKPALQEMIKAARADGVTLTPGSILRTSSRQAQIVANKKKQGQSAKQIYHTSSHPGYSEHHTGLAVDFSPINDNFTKTAGYRWLQQHAHEYGFYQTFTPDYSRYSGVSEESWHWRFEGKNKEFSYVFADSINRRC